MTDSISLIVREIRAELERLRPEGNPAILAMLPDSDAIEDLLSGIGGHGCGEGADFFDQSVQLKWTKEHCVTPVPVNRDVNDLLLVDGFWGDDSFDDLDPQSKYRKWLTWRKRSA